MKLETTIMPRRDGQVIAKVGDAAYTFRADEFGRLVTDVDDEQHIATLLATGDFLPANEGDFEAAALLINSDDGASDGDDGVDDGTQVGDVEDLPDDEGDENAALIEEPAAVVPRAAKKAGKKGA